MKEEIKLKYMTDFKIKGDSEDEVKELLEHIEILDNTDYILHSDKAKALLDYITNLQQKVKQLENIRKEAREYVKKTCIGSILEVHSGEEEEYTEPLLEILSKGENK